MEHLAGRPCRRARARGHEAPGLESLWIEKGAILHSLLPPGEAEPRGRPLFHPAGNRGAVMAPGPGVRHVITSKDDEPAELLVLSIEPAGVWSRSLAPYRRCTTVRNGLWALTAFAPSCIGSDASLALRIIGIFPGAS